MIRTGSDSDLVLKPDVCIVGSGPGGAMVAARLARAMGKARMQVQRWLKRHGLDPQDFR